MNDNAIRWFRQHSRKLICPPCQGKTRPDWMNSNTTKCPCWCPKCKKYWNYRNDISIEIKRQRPWFFYSKINIVDEGRD